MERKIITDKLVFPKTGKTMEEWFKILDKKGAGKMNHSEIYSLVNNIPALNPLGPWNQNLLTTTYEWNRGLKGRGQRDKDFEISISKSISVPLSRLYNAWANAKLREKWLDKRNMTIKKTTINKSLIVEWDNDTTVRVDLYKKGDEKSQVVIQHMKIPDFKISGELKHYWSGGLQKLKNLLEQ